MSEINKINKSISGRIEEQHSIDSVKKRLYASPRPQTQEPAAGDQVTFSAEALNASEKACSAARYAAILSQMPDTDTARVAGVKARIASGGYDSPEVIRETARKFLESSGSEG